MDISKWPPAAQLAYTIAVKAGLNPSQAEDFAAVQYGESGFNPHALNKSSGAAGLYQLLSQGYVNRAAALGGVFNPVANIKAILPDYVAYYRAHPNLIPGAAGAAVERSGEGASYYAQGWQHLVGGASYPVTTGGYVPPSTTPAGRVAAPTVAKQPADNTAALRAILAAASAQLSAPSPTITPGFSALPVAAPATPAPLPALSLLAAPTQGPLAALTQTP